MTTLRKFDGGTRRLRSRRAVKLKVATTRTYLNSEHVLVDVDGGHPGGGISAGQRGGRGDAVGQLVAEKLPVEGGLRGRAPDHAQARAARADLVGEEGGSAAGTCMKANPRVKLIPILLSIERSVGQ